MAELKTRSNASAKDAPAEKKPVKKADSAEKKPAAKKADSAEKKTTEKKTARTDENGKTVKPAKKRGNATGKRVAAVILWVLAIACEVVGILSYFGKITVTFIPTLYFIILVIVLDLVFVIIGSQFWKNANHIDPASEKNKVKFFLWNNMGLIVACFAFIPYLILLIKDKDKLDKKTKAIAIVAAAVALAVGGLTSVDWNPVSQESKAEAIEEICDDTTVFWTQFGKVYHLDSNCQHINNSDAYYEGTVEEAINDNRTRLCKTCAKNHEIDIAATED